MTQEYIEFLTDTPTQMETAVIPLDKAGKPLLPKGLNTPELVALIKHLIEMAAFKAKSGACLAHVLPPKSFAKRLVLVCVGDETAPLLNFEEAGGKLAECLLAAKAQKITLLFEGLGHRLEEIAAAMVNGLVLRQYRFDTYRTRNVADLPKAFEVQVVCGAKALDTAEAYEPLADITHGVVLARNLVNMPPNDLNPTSFAKHAVAVAKQAGLKCTVFDHKALEKMGMGSFIAVGKASETPACMVVLEHVPAKAKKQAPVALIGKGITFDSGGLSIKPPASMPEMKGDMAGAAAVLGTMVALARLGAETPVVAALALAENAISDEAYRPGDVLKTFSGQTVEVLNTDAEGRLVLCDTMSYIQKTYKPKAMVDIATLTGAAIVALGDVYSAIFTPNDALNAELVEAGKESGEIIWRMPVHEAFDADIKSDIADMKNIGSAGKAGSATAAAFLHRFVEEGVAWAHLDMAPMMMLSKDRALYPRGATGWGVRLLTYWLAMRGSA